MSLFQAIVTAYFTDDRYATDVHYQGGCVLGNEMLSWASRMFSWNARPPNPHYTKYWKKQWRERLEKAGDSWAKIWLAHQTRDDYWKYGSICEDPARLKDCAVLAIGRYLRPCCCFL